ncbi:MAG: hypothetical protein ABI346_01870 [Candidatus Baltobacteraceae bacterium]
MRRVATRSVALLLAACALLATPSMVLAKDVPLRIYLDGRPLDRKTSSGLVHRGVSFINVVRATKAFSGLLIFGKNDRSVQVTIRQHRAAFVIGQRGGMLLERPTIFPAPPFELYGDIYVPLTAIAILADVRVSVDVERGVARLTTGQQSGRLPAAHASESGLSWLPARVGATSR